jgi:hypothetical protein
MTELYEVPEIKEELERKTLAELENLVNRRELGRITNAEYLASIGSIFAICSGLVDGGFFELITTASQEFESDYSFNRTRLFAMDKRLMVVSRAKTKKDFRVSILSTAHFDEKVLTGTNDETDTNAETEVKINKLITKLISSGYSEL